MSSILKEHTCAHSQSSFPVAYCALRSIQSPLVISIKCHSALCLGANLLRSLVFTNLAIYFNPFKCSYDIKYYRLLKICSLEKKLWSISNQIVFSNFSDLVHRAIPCAHHSASRSTWMALAGQIFFFPNESVEQ